MKLLYKTSKDYKRLKELIDRGYWVIAIENDAIDFFYCLAEQYFFIDWHLPKGITDKEFEEVCDAFDLEFIEPTEEV